jgi:membrane protein YqaA with SNARE-associated domain
VRLFSSLYELTMRWVAHPYAQWYLAGLSFAESSFFPVPPDVMLAPMALGNRPLAWRFAAITSIASVLGGAAGYLIGMFAFELIQPWLESAGYMDSYRLAVSWFDRWGIWVVFLAGFSPIPYKLFTIAAGVISMAFIPFIVASLIGRSARFFMVAGLMVWGGEKMDRLLRQYIDRVGWAVVVFAIAIFIWIEYF